MNWKRVLATHEEPQVLSTGPWLGDSFPGVALPSKNAMRRWVIIRNGDRCTCAQVMDLGPWCHDDDDYVFGTAKPRAERFKGEQCPVDLSKPNVKPSVPDGNGGFRTVGVSNGAGIDLFPYTAKQLGIKVGSNAFVEWTFIEPWI